MTSSERLEKWLDFEPAPRFTFEPRHPKMKVLLIVQESLAVEVSAGSNRVRIRCGLYGNRASVSLTLDDAEELVKAIGEGIYILRSTAPCGRVALYGYHKRFMQQDRQRAELGSAYLRERMATNPGIGVDVCRGAVRVGLYGDCDGRRLRAKRACIRLLAHEAGQLAETINEAVGDVREPGRWENRHWDKWYSRQFGGPRRCGTMQYMVYGEWAGSPHKQPHRPPSGS